VLSAPLCIEPGNTGSNHQIQPLSGLDGIDLLHRAIGKGGNVETLIRTIGGPRCRQDGGSTLYLLPRRVVLAQEFC